MKKIIILILSYIIITSVAYGSQGKTYPIYEKDAITEIKSAASKVDWNKYLSREAQEKKLKEFKPKGLTKLPNATTSSVRNVDMTYTLEFDIPDGKGGILYPKGYMFNPLDYVRYPGMMIVLDGTRKEQIEWFRKSKYYNKINVKLLLTDGNYYNLKNQLNQSVYYAFPDMIRRFKVSHVPSVIWQKEGSNLMSIMEVGLK
jgi:conjugal transfer pilus assembly protein TraW